MLLVVSVAGFFWFSVLHVSFNYVFKWGCSSIYRTEKAVEKKRYQGWDLGSSKYLVIPEKTGEETLRSHCQFLELGLAELCFYFHIHWYNFGLALARVTRNILQKPSGSFRQSEHTLLSLSMPRGCGIVLVYCKNFPEASSGKSYWSRWSWCPKVAQNCMRQSPSYVFTA